MSEPVLIFGAARTGSSYIVTTLRSHPAVLAHGEPFQTENLHWHFDPTILPRADFALRERAPYQFIRWIYSQALGRQYVVLKILFGQNDETLLRLLGELDVRVIYLRRPNRLAHFASLCLAYRTNLWNRHVGEDAPPEERVWFDLPEFEKFTGWMDRCEGKVQRVFSETGQKCFECNYDPAYLPATARRAAEWLGLDQPGLKDSTLTRLRDSCVMDKFSNPEAVLSAVSELGREDWLNE